MQGFDLNDVLQAEENLNVLHHTSANRHSYICGGGGGGGTGATDRQKEHQAQGFMGMEQNLQMQQGMEQNLQMQQGMDQNLQMRQGMAMAMAKAKAKNGAEAMQEGHMIVSHSQAGNGHGQAGNGHGHGHGNLKYVRYTSEQVEALERLYRQCPKPSLQQRLLLVRDCAPLCNIDPQQIKVWFQNRRCREKQRKESARLQCLNGKLTAMNTMLMDENVQLQQQVAHLLHDNKCLRNQLNSIAINMSNNNHMKTHVMNQISTVNEQDQIAGFNGPSTTTTLQPHPQNDHHSHHHDILYSDPHIINLSQQSPSDDRS